MITFGKCISVVDASSNVYFTCKKEKLSTAEKVNVATQTLFAMSQTAEIALDYSPVDPKVRLIVWITTGVLDIARKITEIMAKEERASKWDCLDVASTVAFRAGCVGHKAIETHGHLFKDYKTIVSDVSKIAVTSSIVVKTIKTVSEPDRKSNSCTPCCCCCNSCNSCSEYDYFLKASPTSSTAAIAAAAAQATNPGSAGNVNTNANASSNARDYVAVEDEQAAFKKQAQALQNWQSLKEIPSFFAKYECFDKCRLSGKPIRCILVPNFETKDTTLIYDKYALEQWLKANPYSCPPGWPVNELFHRSRLVQPASLQRKIDDNLEALVKKIKIADCHFKIG